LTWIPAILRVPLVALAIVVSTLLHTGVLFVVAAIKWLLPIAPVRAALGRVLVRIAESWIGVNSALLDRCTPTRVVATGLPGLRPDGHYLVLANHRSWVDIIVLQYVLNRRAPLMRFFLKSQLLWVPLLGLAWWALDFPFMKRYSRKVLAKRPELAGRDIAATRRACEKFRGMPVAIMNFVEGTRLTEEKRRRQESPYAHLLKPKAGGMALVLDAMGEALHSVLDVTIAYPDGTPTLGDLVGGRIREVRVDVRAREIPPDFRGLDYERDPAARVRYQRWLNSLWADKDALLATLLGDPAEDSGAPSATGAAAGRAP
jgi:1-acyl-sn-glycerol-3-phosphate acyltransferase